MFIVVSKSGCKYCDMARELLEERKEDFLYFDREEFFEVYPGVEKPRTYPLILTCERERPLRFERLGGFSDLERHFVIQDALKEDF